MVRREHRRLTTPLTSRSAGVFENSDSERERDAVAAGIGHGYETTAFAIYLDHLHGSHCRIDGIGQHDLVPTLGEIGGNALAEARLEHQGAARESVGRR